jgi:hypothetical protein
LGLFKTFKIYKMKKVIHIMIGVMLMITSVTMAQKIDEARMTRDIAVAENILSTLIKQEFDKRTLFPIEVKGNYQSGYGVIFIIPSEMLTSMAWSFGGNRDIVMLDGSSGAFTYSWSPDTEVIRGDVEHKLREAEDEMERSEKALAKSEKELLKADKELKTAQKARTPGAVTRTRTSYNSDSLKALSQTKLVQAAKNFIADYGDMISQLGTDERIVITNRNNSQHSFFGPSAKQSLISIEASKADLNQFKQGKISRDQLLAKLKIINTSSSGRVEPDIELLTSIFNRLYRSDLAKTFYISGNTFYDRLTDFGAVIYMQVYSSNQVDDGLYDMPTVELRRVDQATRDRKVKELYPQFERELKENILDYGRTVKSLNDNEQLIFNVKLTRCKGCGIPADVEISVKSSVLKDYNSGKIDKNNALGKMVIKKGAVQ